MNTFDDFDDFFLKFDDLMLDLSSSYGHKVVHFITKTILKLSADCAKQSIRIAQNCEKTNHDNAPTHISMLVREFFTKNNSVFMIQPPYSALANFFLFPKLKTRVKTKPFAMIEEIKEKSKQNLLATPKNAFQKSFEDWKNRWHTCNILEEEYYICRAQDNY